MPPQLVGDSAQRLVPTDDAVMGVAGAGMERLRQPAAPFQLPRRQSGKLLQAVGAKEVGPECALHVADHCLKGFFAHLRPMSGLVPHPALLATHAESTSLASVLGPHCPPEPPPAD